MTERQLEMDRLRRTMREQEAWGKFSVRNANRLGQLEAEERAERWGFDPLCAATWAFAVSYCLLFWLSVGAGLWRFAKPLIDGMMALTTGGMQ